MPLIGQWGLQANRYTNDCGAACVAMCLEWAGKRGRLTVDQLASETALRYGDVGLVPAQLVKLAAKHDLATRLHYNTSEDDLRREINAGRPVIALLAYRFVLNRLDQADNVPGRDGHYLNLVGYDDTHFIADDPDVWVPYLERGHNTPILATELKRALAEYSGQCIFMENAMTLQEQFDALADEIKVLAAQIPTGAPPPVPPAPVEDPLPGTPEEKVIGEAVNVRLDTDAESTRLDGLPAGQRVTIQGAVAKNGHIWASVTKVNGVVRTYQVGGRTVYGKIARDVAFPQ
jgi:hypothetical protein